MPGSSRRSRRRPIARCWQPGYTAVAEFHYLHGDPGSDGDAMFAALMRRRTRAGIRLVYVPVLYERAGFDLDEPLAHQRRFVMSSAGVS